MTSNWITISEAIKLTGKSERTIRRYASKYKKDIKRIKKESNTTFIDNEFLLDLYSPDNDRHMAGNTENVREKKEAMQIAYNSEIIKKKDDQLDVKDRLIEQLINKKTPLLRHSTFWVTVGFCVLITLSILGGYFYRIEYQKQYQEKYHLVVNAFNGKLSILEAQNELLRKTVSNIDLDSKNLSGSLKMQNKELFDQNKVLTVALSRFQKDYKTILGDNDVLHVKYGEEIELLEKENKKLRKQNK